MNQSICMDKGWRHHPRFKLLRARSGKGSIEEYFMLQDYVVEHCDDLELELTEQQRDNICIDLGLTQEELARLLEAVQVCGLVRKELRGGFFFYVFEKTKKHLTEGNVKDNMIARARGSDRIVSDMFCPSPAEKQFSPAPQGENFSQPGGTDQKIDTIKYDQSSNLQGLRINLAQLVDDLTLAHCKSLEHWMKREAERAGFKRKLDIDKKRVDWINKEYSTYGERFFMGAWRIYVWSENYKRLDDRSRTQTPVQLFLKFIGEKVDRFSSLTGEEVSVQRTEDLRPKVKPEDVSESRPESKSLEIVSEKKEETMLERRLRELGEDDIENALKNLDRLGKGPED